MNHLEITKGWKAPQWRKHEQQRGKLLTSLDHFAKVGYTDEQIHEMVTSMLTFNREWNDRLKILADVKPTVEQLTIP